MSHASKPIKKRILGWLELVIVSFVALLLLDILTVVFEHFLLPADFRLGLEGSPGGLNLSRFLAYSSWLFLLGGFLVWRLGRNQPKSSWWARLDLTRPSWAALGWGAVALLAAYGLSLALAVLLSQLDLINLDQKQRIGFSLRGSWPVFWAFLTIVIIVPIGEELLFRRWLYRRLAELGPAWLALSLAPLLFGLAHWPPLLAAIDTLIFATAVILVYRKFGNLWPPILMHSAKNAIALSLLVFGVV